MERILSRRVYLDSWPSPDGPRRLDFTTYRGTLDEVLAALPAFERRHFQSEDGGRNMFLDQIVRLPVKPDGKTVPVAVVSPFYRLIQHRDVLLKAIEAVRGAGVSIHRNAVEVSTTHYGERVVFSVPLDVGLDPSPVPGDIVQIRLNCENSMDRGTKLCAYISTLRLVCTNGMVVEGWDCKFKKSHSWHMDFEDFDSTLVGSLNTLQYVRDRNFRWAETPVPLEILRQWVDEPLRARWGVSAAARTWHISTRGLDVRLAGSTRMQEPSDKPVQIVQPVPGSRIPCGNAYDAAQALSWIASGVGNSRMRLERQIEIPALIEALIAMN